eukprot:m.187345 g.187345  ORF g.187345 m.187345 type:complete len:326 (-) comp24796_c0_seq2:2225-3202(-)
MERATDVEEFGDAAQAMMDFPVHVVEFSPFVSTAGLLAVGGHAKVMIARVETDPTEIVPVLDLHHDTRITAIGWSPITPRPEGSLASSVIFCTAGGDFKLRIYTAALDDQTSEMVELSGHTDIVNAVSFDTLTGRTLASTGDDHTIRLWNADDAVQLACIQLDSPGTSVIWIPQTPSTPSEPQPEFQKFLAAERQGSVRLFYASAQRQLAGETLRAGRAPLLDADYSDGQVGVVADGRLVRWTLPSSGVAEAADKSAFLESPSCFRWGKARPVYSALGGVDGYQVFGEGHDCILQRRGHCTSLTWHALHNTCCFAVGSTIQIFIA